MDLTLEELEAMANQSPATKWVNLLILHMFKLVMRRTVMFCLLSACLGTSSAFCAIAGWEYVSEAACGRFPILENTVWGYMDRSGKVVIEPQFDYVHTFCENMGRVVVDEKH